MAKKHPFRESDPQRTGEHAEREAAKERLVTRAQGGMARKASVDRPTDTWLVDAFYEKNPVSWLDRLGLRVDGTITIP